MPFVEDGRNVLSARTGDVPIVDFWTEWGEWLRTGAKSFTDFLFALARFQFEATPAGVLLGVLVSPFTGATYANPAAFEAHLTETLQRFWKIDWARLYSEATA